MPVRIGIITCANCTQELDCCSSSCLADLSEGKGAFGAYASAGGAVLGGLISCAGCPTLAHPGKILRKVQSLARFGIRDIHLANCMLFSCPFLGKYKKAINEAFPEISLIEGTHVAHNSPEMFRTKVRTAFEQNRAMADIILGTL